MNKYNMIMKEIRLTEDMEKRILTEIRLNVNQKPHRKFFTNCKMVVAFAALIFLISGIICNNMANDNYDHILVGSTNGENYTYNDWTEKSAGNACNADGMNDQNFEQDGANDRENNAGLQHKKDDDVGITDKQSPNEESGSSLGNGYEQDNAGDSAGSGQSVGIAYYASIGELAGSLDFRLAVPQVLPEGYRFETALNQFGTAVICYNNGSRQLKYCMERVGSGKPENISGRQLRAGIYMHLVSDENIRVEWRQNGFLHTLIGSENISDDKWLEIVDSVSPVKK